VRSCAINPKFAWWALIEAKEQLNLVSTGSTYDAVAAEDVANLRIVHASGPEQEARAVYLEREIAEADVLVAAKERLLEVIADKRRAVIARAVTRGLNPDAPLRDSGVPWLGRIPTHWQVQRAKWLFKERDERSITGEETLLSLRMEVGLVPHNDVSEKPMRSEDLIGYKRTSPNEIVLNRMRAASGLVAVSPEEGLVSPDYAVFQASASADPNFFTHLFRTELMQAVFRAESTGLGTGSSGFLRLYSESFLSLWLPVPPLCEQRDIVAFIAHETGRLGALRSAAERTVGLLKERRAALIAAGVTGQIKVADTK
jgi:type I restriction enzyme S subunit